MKREMKIAMTSLLMALVISANAWITDVCLECTFPWHIGGFNLSSQKDFVQYNKQMFCSCNHLDLKLFKLPKVWGIPLALWEPQAIVEVTHTPYKFQVIGGYTLSKSSTLKSRGSISNSDAGRSSFYNVHYYIVPLFRVMQVLPGFTCLRNMEVSTPVFMTEWFPFWNDMDSAWHWIVDPARFLYSHPHFQEICKKDCEASMNREPSDKYHWCAGCLGSLYPFCGHVGYHIGSIQASSLLLCRIIGFFHSFGEFFEIGGFNKIGLGKGYKADNFCEKTYSRTLRKTIYKTQLIRPIPDRGREKNGVKLYCHPLGDSDRDWGFGHIVPVEGEDLLYIVWTKLHCCYDVLDVFKKAISASLAAFELISEGNQSEKMKKGEEIRQKIKHLGDLEKQLEGT